MKKRKMIRIKQFIRITEGILLKEKGRKRNMKSIIPQKHFYVFWKIIIKISKI